jgi:hypothetical protein
MLNEENNNPTRQKASTYNLLMIQQGGKELILIIL